MNSSFRKNLKFILPAVILIMLVGLILSRVYQPEPDIPEPEITITAKEAKNHIGEAAEVCGLVAAIRYLPQIGGQPTFINFGQPDPNQDFTAVIWGENRAKWQQSPRHIYTNKRLCVTGRIESHEETPQIIVEQPSQIRVLGN